MRLRKQLLLLSLVTLIIPWAGCQYIKELQNTLDLSQIETLQATGNAIAISLERDPESLKSLKERTISPGLKPLFGHRKNIETTLDGYDEEWASQEIPFINLDIYNSNTIHPKKNKDESQTSTKTASIKPKFMASVAIGYFKEKLSLYFKIVDEEIIYFNPTNKDQKPKGSALYDRLFIYIRKPNMLTMSIFEISASAPGKIQVHDVTDINNKIEHQIKGQWLENANGYQVELSFPISWSRQGLRIEVENAENHFYASSTPDNESKTNTKEQTQKKTDTTTNNLPTLITQSQMLDQALAAFSNETITIRVLDSNNNLLAMSRAKNKTQSEDYPWIIRALYQSLLSNKNSTKTQSNVTIIAQGTEKTISTRSLIKTGLNDSLIDKNPIYVEIEKQTNVLSSYTNNAFSRLILYSIFTTFGVVLLLVAYSTWLSLRIKQVGRAAQTALLKQGKISTDFPNFKVKDEINELSANYEILLKRLEEYTRYLQTLASKLSHELRTPLAIVSSSLDNLSYSDLDEQASVYAARANDGAQRLSFILSAMSSATRIEQSIHSAEKIHFDLAQVLPELTQSYIQAYPQTQLTLDMPSEAGLLINGAPDLFVQMLDKLVDNACDFCDGNGPVIIKSIRVGNNIQLSVSNPGPSLPEGMSTQLFDSLVSLRTQSDTNDDKARPHLGLGLHIVSLIIEFHGGTVRATNLANDTGVEFTLSLPAASQ